MADTLNGAKVSPSADVRFKVTFTRTADDIDPSTGLATDYEDCTISMLIVALPENTTVTTLTIGSGLTRVTNTASSQVLSGRIPQATINANAGSTLAYRFTLTTASGGVVSGSDKKPGYYGRFEVRSF
jgi:hypothetical protein